MGEHQVNDRPIPRPAGTLRAFVHDGRKCCPPAVRDVAAVIAAAVVQIADRILAERPVAVARAREDQAIAPSQRPNRRQSFHGPPKWRERRPPTCAGAPASQSRAIPAPRSSGGRRARATHRSAGSAPHERGKDLALEAPQHVTGVGPTPSAIRAWRASAVPRSRMSPRGPPPPVGQLSVPSAKANASATSTPR